MESIGPGHVNFMAVCFDISQTVVPKQYFLIFFFPNGILTEQVFPPVRIATTN